jgi:probable rRNA maturation factor
MITVVNLQRKVKISAGIYRNFALELATVIPEANGKTFSVAFISDRRMKQLNEMFRGISATTDVLSFPNEPDDFDPDHSNLGDIVISTEQARKQAYENGLAFEIEIKQLILHGVLHLLDMDHETDQGEMNERELEIRGRIGI